MTKAKKGVKSKNKSSRSHLTLEDRAKIEFGLNHGHSFHTIAKAIGKSVATVSMEIDRNCKYIPTKMNNCALIKDCAVQGLCDATTRKGTCKAFCSNKCIKKCHTLCDDYQPQECDKRLAAPRQICNGCTHINYHCRYNQYIYDAAYADKRARELLRSRNQGFDLTDEELAKIDIIITAGVNHGQSPYHIVISNQEELGISVSTVYRLIDSGAIGAKNIDLKEKVKRKPRRSQRRIKHAAYIEEMKVGRMWGDYLEFMDENDDLIHPQMDTVEGIKSDSKAILTLHWQALRMQIGIVLDRQNSACVVNALDDIESLIGTELFKEAFPIILTDNGSEFDDVFGMERSVFDPKMSRTKVFFCEPNKPNDKGACEKNHRHVREIIPKGTSIENLTQVEVNLMFNNINSYRRKGINGKSAYDLAMAVFPEEFFDILGLYQIKDTEVTLKPKLLTDFRKGILPEAVPPTEKSDSPDTEAEAS